MALVQQAAERDMAAFTERIMSASIRKRGIMFYFQCRHNSLAIRDLRGGVSEGIEGRQRKRV